MERERERELYGSMPKADRLVGQSGFTHVIIDTLNQFDIYSDGPHYLLVHYTCLRYCNMKRDRQSYLYENCDKRQ